MTIGVEIIPYNSYSQSEGISRFSSVAFEFDEDDVLETLKRDGKQFLRLSLGTNNSNFDSYLVAENDVVAE